MESKLEGSNCRDHEKIHEIAGRVSDECLVESLSPSHSRPQLIRAIEFIEGRSAWGHLSNLDSCSQRLWKPDDVGF